MATIITGVDLEHYLDSGVGGARGLRTDDGATAAVHFAQGCVLHNPLTFPVTRDLHCFPAFGIFAPAKYAMVGAPPPPGFVQALDRPAPPGRYFAMGCSDNYFHWLVDFLPRLAVRALVPDGGERRVVLDRPPSGRALEALQVMVLGLGLDGFDLFVAGDEWTDYPDLVVPLPARDRAAALWGVVLGRTRALLPPVEVARRLFVRRGTTGRRTPVNEDEVANALEPRGFRSVDPGAMSFVEQVALFAGADVIVGGHGAAFTNLLFAPADATVVELRGSVRQPFFGRLAAGRGMRYAEVPGADVPGSHTAAHHCDYAVPVADLLDRLDALGVR
ncbi:glycosyltransferase family 61 protein [Azospirillum halopraeferens]|uniref:glycosyltransferase family 61 protein n=1 Tax=Azospirillum halopraeferens TaxID=34010 RepID=UPI0003FF12CF|nr:glycosyltransferase family 61 protein [Azospirillum halopraeferens]